MRPAESVAAFEAFAESNGVSLIGITPRDGVTQMLAFYETLNAEGCTGPSSDMLLFQWGTYDWGEGKHFEVSVTRQFIELGADSDTAISQLQLAFAFLPTEETTALGEGNRWCDSHTEVGVFRTFVLSSRPLCIVAEEEPPGVSLRHSYVYAR